MNQDENFYKNQFDFYKSKYWKTNHNDFVIPNGFTNYPLETYNYFSNILNNKVQVANCKLLDICCGNGLLLKHLMDTCNFEIIPFGIDFQTKSINQAKSKIHKEHKDNFITQNAKFFDFTKKIYDIILFDPYHFTDTDLKVMTDTITKNVGQFVLFYCYADVLKNLTYKCVSDFPALNSLNLDTYNYDEISFGLCYTKK